MPLTMADAVEAARERSRRRNSLLSKQLAVAVKSVQWSYAIFWSSSPTQTGVLEWGEGCYNGDMKKRKKRYEIHYKHVLQRSNQLRKLYLCMLEGDSTTTISTTHDVDNYQNRNSTSMMLSPDDLSDEEWYYLVSMSYVFSPSQCLPGRALATGDTIWLCNAQYADNKLFSRSLLARSASIQTVVCFPYLGGVIEMGVTELISEDPSLLQHIKSCLLETSKPINSPVFSAHQDNDDEKNQIKIKISDGNLVLQENHQIQFGISDLMLDEDLDYKRTVSTVLNYAADKNSHHGQPDQVSSNAGSSFLLWKQHKQPNSNLLQKHSNLQPKSQNVLRKALHDVPLMHSVDEKRMLTDKTFGLNQDDPSDKRKENEKFSVLRSMVPTANEVDKESILINTIKYLKELKGRVVELESCMGSVNYAERQRKSLNDSVLIEETSGNYEDSTKIYGNSGETEQATCFRDETHLRVNLKETEVVIEVKCSYRDYIVAHIMETLSKLHMDALSVRSHTLNGFLTLNLKANLRGAAVASLGMIKRELSRVTGRPVYYVLLQCGTKEYRSKLSKGDNHNALWNQKFVFDFPMSQWKKLTHIKFRIMDKELFKDGGFVGETIIDLKGIVTEGGDRGYMEVKPTPYNVVLDDDTFKGVLKLGFRFTHAPDKLRRNAWEQKIESKNGEEAMNSPILSLMKLPLLRFLMYFFQKTTKYQLKDS